MFAHITCDFANFRFDKITHKLVKLFAVLQKLFDGCFRKYVSIFKANVCDFLMSIVYERVYVAAENLLYFYISFICDDADKLVP